MLSQLVEASEDELAAAHGATFHSGDHLVTEKNVLGSFFMSDSECVWRLRASASVVVDDPRRIVDFSLLKLRSFWVHPDAPITRMNMRQAVDTLWGLEWALCSDVKTWKDRTKEWFDEFWCAFCLVRNRLFYLSEGGSSDPDVLNMHAYAENLYSIKPATDESMAGYESDEEKHARPTTTTKKRARVELDASFEQFHITPMRVNDDFVHDVNTATRSIEDAVFTRWKISHGRRPPTPIPKINLTKLRARVLEEAKHVRESEIVEFRRTFYWNLIMTESYMRVHKRVATYDLRPKARNALVKKHESIVSSGENVPESLGDMTTPRVPVDPVMTRLDGDACLFYSSAAIPTEDEVRRLWVGNLDWRALPSGKEGAKIGRLPAEERYILFVGEDERYSATSFMGAFAFWRIKFREGKSRYDDCLLG